MDMVWPRRCVVCGECLDTDEEHLCSDCMEDMPLTYFWSWRDNPAEQILWARTRLESVVSLFYYSRDNDYRRLLYSLKYKGDIALGRWLGRMLGEKMREADCPRPDVIIPVPLHWRRKWRRGYNQAEAIARGISESLGDAVPVLPGIPHPYPLQHFPDAYFRRVQMGERLRSILHQRQKYGRRKTQRPSHSACGRCPDYRGYGRSLLGCPQRHSRRPCLLCQPGLCRPAGLILYRPNSLRTRSTESSSSQPKN